MNAMKKEEQLPEDVELLLPWHAAGTLSRRDAARVEQALTNDNELARRYEMVRDELGEAIHLNETLGAPSARAMEQLFAKIDAEPVRKPKISFSITVWMTEFAAGFSPRTLAYSASAAALAIVLQAGILTSVYVKDSTFSTASTSQQDMTASAGSFVHVRFNPQATAGVITKFLEENKATVIGGPAAGSGMFKLRVAETPMQQSELGAVVKNMAKNPVVGFTVPAAQP